MGDWQRAVFPSCTFRVGGDEFVVAEDEIAGRLEKSWLNHLQRKYFLRLTKAVLYAGTAIFPEKV